MADSNFRSLGIDWVCFITAVIFSSFSGIDNSVFGLGTVLLVAHLQLNGTSEIGCLNIDVF